MRRCVLYPVWINSIKTHSWKVTKKLNSAFSDLYNDSQEKHTQGFQSSKLAPGFKNIHYSAMWKLNKS